MTGTAGFWGDAMDSLPGDGGHRPSCIHDHHDMKHLEPVELPTVWPSRSADEQILDVKTS